MANTALIKRSSVANKAPTTSDLSLGELAVNTYDGKLFLKKNVGGTESIVDLTNADKLDGQDGSYYTGYTDTAIANLIDSAPNALNTLNELSAALNDDASFSTTVTNSIATKLPLAGGSLTGNLSITKNNPVITFNDTNNNPDYQVGNVNGVLRFQDITNNATRFQVNTDGHVDFKTNVDCEAGLDVTGTCTATTFSGSGASLTNIPAAQLEGVLPALDGSNLTGIIASGQDATTLDSLDSTQFLRSDADDTTTGILSLTTNSQYPLTIDGDHNGKIALKGATDPYIAFFENTTRKAYIQWNDNGYLLLYNEESSEALRIENGSNGLKYGINGTYYNVWHQGNDGSGSTLDADTVDGLDSSQFLRSDTTETFTGNEFTFSSSAEQKIILQGASNPYIRFKEGTDNKAYIQWSAGGFLQIINQEDLSGIRIKDNISFTKDNFSTEHKIWNESNDGSGSGLDADKLDNREATQFIWDYGTSPSSNINTLGGQSGKLRWNNTTVGRPASGQSNEYGTVLHLDYQGSQGSQLAWDIAENNLYARTLDYSTDSGTWVRFLTENDEGSGNGLDADTVDNIQASSFLRADTNDTINASYEVTSGKRIRFGHANQQNDDDGGISAGNHGSGLNIVGTKTLTTGQRQIRLWGDLITSAGSVFWNAGNDGSGSGLDADTVDGIQASSFLRSDANDTLSAIITGHSSNTEVIRLNSAAYSSSLYLGGWNTTNTNDIARIRSSSNLHIDSQANGNLYLNWYASNKGIYLGNTGQGIYAAGSNVVFHAGNDGAGSGLDSDTLDGQHGSYYADAASYVKEIRTDDDITSRMDSGFYETATATTAEGWPETTNSWYHLISSTHSNTGNYYSMQIAGNFFDQKFYIRNTHASGTRAWSQIWTTSSDGSGSGLDSDTLDGIQAAKFLTSYSSSYTTGWEDSNRNFRVTTGGSAAGLAFHESDGTFAFQIYGDGSAQGFLVDNWSHWDLRKYYDGQLYLRVSGTNYLAFHSGNDGSGSGLDADTVDGIQASSFIRSDANDTVTGQINFKYNDSSGNYKTIEVSGNGNHAGIVINPAANKQAHLRFYTAGTPKWQWRTPFQDGANEAIKLYSWVNAADKFVFNHDGSALFNSSTVWTAGNDGSGSGLDADTLDGKDLSNSYTSTNSVVMRDSNGNMNAHYATLRKDVAGGVGAYLTIQNQSNNTNTSCGITFGAGTSNAILDGGDYGEAQIKCFRDSGGYGNLEINLHTGANRPVMKMVGNGGAYNGAGAGTEGMRGGVAFGNAGIAIDRSWMGQPGIHVFNSNVENDTDQGTFRFHGWNRSYASYPNNSGSDFGVTLVADGMTLTSDRRRKTGISTITDALATVLQMRGVSYTYVNEELQPQTHMSMDNGKKLGFIAQEVIPLLPQLIHDSGEKAVERENGYCDRYNMDYGGVAPLLVEAIKELVQRIVALESK